MIKNLVIVESPAKAKTIEGYLGKDFVVKSSFGHVRDLPKDNNAIDIENGFKPTYVISSDKKEVVSQLRKALPAETEHPAEPRGRRRRGDEPEPDADKSASAEAVDELIAKHKAKASADKPEPIDHDPTTGEVPADQEPPMRQPGED